MNELEQRYISHVEKCFEKAQNLESKITDEIKNMPGMSGLMTRHFYNNLLSMDDARYLEVGCWQGSSCCSAMCGNNATISIVEDFSGFGSPREILLDNLEKHRGANDVTFYEQDCFKMDLSEFKNKFNLYLWDADHSEHSTKMSIEYFLPCLEDVFVLVMDDWNQKEVRSGTYLGISESNLEVIGKKEIRLSNDNEFTHNQEEAKNTFWNGIAIFILKKQN